MGQDVFHCKLGLLFHSNLGKECQQTRRALVVTLLVRSGGGAVIDAGPMQSANIFKEIMYT